jgi:hypothetical protein
MSRHRSSGTSEPGCPPFHERPVARRFPDALLPVRLTSPENRGMQ